MRKSSREWYTLWKTIARAVARKTRLLNFPPINQAIFPSRAESALLFQLLHTWKEGVWWFRVSHKVIWLFITGYCEYPCCSFGERRSWIADIKLDYCLNWNIVYCVGCIWWRKYPDSKQKVLSRRVRLREYWIDQDPPEDCWWDCGSSSWIKWYISSWIDRIADQNLYQISFVSFWISHSSFAWDQRINCCWPLWDSQKVPEKYHNWSARPDLAINEWTPRLKWKKRLSRKIPEPDPLAI